MSDYANEAVKWCHTNDLSDLVVNALLEWGVENMTDLQKLDVIDLSELSLTGKLKSQLRKAIETTLPNSTLAKISMAATANGLQTSYDEPRTADLNTPASSPNNTSDATDGSDESQDSYAKQIAFHRRKVPHGSRNDVVVLGKVPIPCAAGSNFVKYIVRTGAALDNSSNFQQPVILLLGKTGAGKSTFINYLVNFVLGVKVDDPFRFLLVRENASQTQSVTKRVTVYDLPACDPNVLPCGLTLIDTPGFADTQGQQRDEEVVSHIRQLLSSSEGVTYLHKIVYVASATECRLTPETAQVIDAVTTMFASDISDHIEVVLTKADNPDATYDDALACLSEAGLPVQNTSKLNQSVLYCPNSKFTDFMWNKANKPSLVRFIGRLLEVDPPNSLQNTLGLNEMRELLVSVCDQTKNKIRFLVSQEVEFQRTHDKLLKRQSSIADAFKEVILLRKFKTLLGSKDKALNCQSCNATCHKWCKGGPTHCHFLRSPNGSCKSCGCHRSKHSLDKFVYELKEGRHIVRDEVAVKSIQEEVILLESVAQLSESQLSDNRKRIGELLNKIVVLKQEIRKLSMHTLAKREYSADKELQSIEQEIMKNLSGDEDRKRFYSRALSNLKLWLAENAASFEASLLNNRDSYLLPECNDYCLVEQRDLAESNGSERPRNLDSMLYDLPDPAK